MSYEKIEKSEIGVAEAKEGGYTHILLVDGVNLYALDLKDYKESANEIAKLNGKDYYDDESDVFFGCGFDDADLVQELIKR